MKKIANLKGVKALNKNEQKAIQGGRMMCCEWCSDGSCQDWYYGTEKCSFAPAC